MMAKNLTTIFNEVAVAIQEKTGKTAPIAAEDFGDQIRAIETKSNTKVREGLRFSTSNLCVHLDKLLEYLPDEVKSLHVRSTDYSGSAFSFGTLNIATITYLWNDGTDDHSSSMHEPDSLSITNHSWGSGTNVDININWYEDELIENLNTSDFNANSTVEDLLTALIQKHGSPEVNISFSFSGRNISEYVFTETPIHPTSDKCFTLDAIAEILTEQE